jgi:hypothetical protein
MSVISQSAAPKAISMGHFVFERVADAMAVATLVTWMEPTLLLWLTEISLAAALVMPPVALLWIVIQIVKTIVPWLRSMRPDGKETEHRGDHHDP